MTGEAKPLTAKRDTCDGCGLFRTCFRPFMGGRWNPDRPKLAIVGEFPGQDDDTQGKPFSGRIGQVVSNLLDELGISESDVWLTNAVRCRPPNNDLEDKAIKHCREFLADDLKAVQPSAILLLGNGPLYSLFDRRGVNSLHGQVLQWEGIPVVPTFHPSFCLKNPSVMDAFIDDAIKAWEIATTGQVTLPATVNYRVVRDDRDLTELEQEVQAADAVAWDIETTGLDAWAEDASVVCVQFSTAAQTGWMVPLAHHECASDAQFFRRAKLETIRVILEESGVPLIGQNLKFDMGYVRANLDINPRTPVFDLFIAHHLLFENESQSGGNGLKSMAWKYTDMGGYERAVEREYGGKKNWYKDIGNIPLDPVPGKDPEACLKHYACGDVDVTFRIWKILAPLIEKQGMQRALQLDLQEQNLLVNMEFHGAAIDWDYHARMIVAFPEQLENIVRDLRGFPEVMETENLYPEKRAKVKKKGELVAPDPVPFNANSPAQVSLLCYNVLGLPKNDKWINDKTGEYSTRREVIDAWLAKLPRRCVARDVIELIVQRRQTSKLFGTYIEPLPGFKGRDGRIHTRFNLARAVTGRLTSESPNLMNLPRDDEEHLQGKVGKGDIKRLFVGGQPGWWVCEADYSQIEYRGAAFLSQDKMMLDAYETGIDYHSLTCSKIFKLSLEELQARVDADDPVAKAMRVKAKTVNFGMMYGMQAKALAEKTGVSVRVAEAWIEEYFTTYSGFAKWVKKIHREAIQTGQVNGMFGHVRHLPNVYSEDRGTREEALRQAVNFPIQNLASKITIYAEMMLDKIFREQGFQSYFFGQVHDANWATGPEAEKKAVPELIKYGMENTGFDFLDGSFPGLPRVPPIIADVKIGSNLRDLRKIAA